MVFPNDTMVLGKYLGPSIDVGPVMTSCIMKANGELEDCSMVCALTSEEHPNAALF